MAKDFRDNTFTDRGFEAIDHVVSNVLKRGSNRSGEPHVDITFPSGMIIELDSDDKKSIRDVIDMSDADTVGFCGDVVLSTLNRSVKRAKRMHDDAIGETF